jgi:hypothetical protein
MVAKYAYRLPDYRQQDLFASCGWTPARSSLLNVPESAVHLIRPGERYCPKYLGLKTAAAQSRHRPEAAK